MAINPWYEIAYQYQKAIDDPPSDRSGFEDGFDHGPDGYFETLFEDSHGEGDDPIPLSYYTKACAWASDYPLLYRRVMVFINPWHLQNESDLDEYIRLEFGCDRDTFVKMIADGWILPLLELRHEYPEWSKSEITELFREVDKERAEFTPVPRYVNLVDTALGAMLLRDEDTLDSYETDRSTRGEYVNIDDTVEAMETESPWKTLPTDKIENNYGVTHPSLREYVTERAQKLRLISDALDDVAVDDIYGTIHTMAENWSEENREEFINYVYYNWNQHGTPAYYCDFSGNTDMGMKPTYEYSRYSLHAVRSYISNAATAATRQVRAILDSEPAREFWFHDEENDLRSIFSVSPQEDVTLDRVESRIDELSNYYRHSNQGKRRKINTFKSREDNRKKLVKRHNKRSKEDINVNLFESDSAQIQKLGELAFSFVAYFNPVVDGMGRIMRFSKKEENMEVKIHEPQKVIDNKMGSLNHWEIPYNTTSQESEESSSETQFDTLNAQYIKRTEEL
jgi:hypothetical protein